MSDNTKSIDSTSVLPTRITRSMKGDPARVPEVQSACLIQYSGDTLGRRYVLSAPETTIGRSAAAAMVLADDSVSREHAKCIAAGNAVEIEDLGSSNGTFINDQRVQGRAALRDGDIVRLGSVHLKYFSRDSIENVFHDNIYRKATIDADTGIFNKQYLLESLDLAFMYSRAKSQPLSVIYFDLDFFKKVNDTHGHSCGDAILRECAQIMKSCLRDEDVLGRYGGEEFVVVLPNCDAQLAATLAERIRIAVESHAFVHDDKTIKQTVSIGVSENSPAFNTGKALLDDADRKLYQSKNSGRNRVTV